MEMLKKWILPLLLFLFLIVDGVLSKSLAPLLGDNAIIVPVQLSLIFQSLIAFYNPSNRYWVYVIIGIGLIGDIFYAGLIGINATLYAVIFYVIQINAKKFPDIKLARAFIVLMSTLGYQLSFGIMTLVFRIQTKSGLVYGLPAVLKTLILTMILFFILDKLFVSYIKKYPFIKST
ncbi:rod shape-determining protein MreD [Holzapfeliella sp. He02]|uniref:Rod shape-determining protein MreD n=1 Tax=Holzapfeliella saturejae TaxID=3082953 RepID=A0ABU8SH16_9LACO